MAAAIKGVFLTIVVVAVFLPLDGVDGLKCYICSTDLPNGTYAIACRKPNWNETTTTCKTSCGKNREEAGGFHRGCTSEKLPDGCTHVVIGGSDLPGCALQISAILPGTFMELHPS